MHDETVERVRRLLPAIAERAQRADDERRARGRPGPLLRGGAGDLDAHAGSVHVANDVERALALYGRSAFGLPVEDDLV